MCPIPLAQNSPEAMGRNFYVLIGAWFYFIVVLVGLLALWVAIRMLLWRWAKRRSERQAEAAQCGPDGKPYPPSAKGLCDRCGHVYDRVYHLPGGGRRCPTCYEKDRS